MKFIIATHNKGKKAELERILRPLGIEVCLPDELGTELSDVEETGETFKENAYLKASSACRESGLPAVADDSGLCVDALDGAPGVYTARYGGEDLPYPEKFKLMLKALDGVPEEKRTARFVSTICCVMPGGKTLYAEGFCEGKIGFAPTGDGGFGFDPLFMVDDKSFAQLTPEEKDAVSHRGNALRNFAKILKEDGDII